MMTYSQFTQYVELHIREYVSEEMMVSSKTWQQKNNGVPIEGLVFKDNGALVDMPVMVYFKDLYEKYCKGDASINSFLQETVNFQIVSVQNLWIHLLIGFSFEW